VSTVPTSRNRARTVFRYHNGNELFQSLQIGKIAGERVQCQIRSGATIVIRSKDLEVSRIETNQGPINSRRFAKSDTTAQRTGSSFAVNTCLVQ